MKPLLDQPDEKPYRHKEKTPWLLVIFLLSIIGCVTLPIARLFLGTIYVNEVGAKDSSASLLARAFTKYPDSHRGRYPVFRTSEEVKGILVPLVNEDLSKSDCDEPERRKRYLDRLDEDSKEIVWNQSLSGGKAVMKSNNEYASMLDAPTAPWAFYLSRKPDRRFIVVFANGEHTILTKEKMTSLIGHPVADP